MTSQKDQNIANQINITAPIYIPTIDSLAINLVPADLVYRLEEYRSDASRWEATFWTLIGAIIGVIVNWVTNDPINISRTSIVVIAFLLVMAVLIGIAARDYRKRADIIKSQMLLKPQEKPSTASSLGEKVTVFIIDINSAKSVTAELPSDASLHRLVPALVTKMQLPNNIQYSVFHKEAGKIIKPMETLRSAGVQDGDTLMLTPMETTKAEELLRNLSPLKSSEDKKDG